MMPVYPKIRRAKQELTTTNRIRITNMKIGQLEIEMIRYRLLRPIHTRPCVSVTSLAALLCDLVYMIAVTICVISFTTSLFVIVKPAHRQGSPGRAAPAARCLGCGSASRSIPTAIYNHYRRLCLPTMQSMPCIAGEHEIRP